MVSYRCEQVITLNKMIQLKVIAGTVHTGLQPGFLELLILNKYTAPV